MVPVRVSTRTIELTGIAVVCVFALATSSLAVLCERTCGPMRPERPQPVQSAPTCALQGDLKFDDHTILPGYQAGWFPRQQMQAYVPCKWLNYELPA